MEITTDLHPLVPPPLHHRHHRHHRHPLPCCPLEDLGSRVPRQNTPERGSGGRLASGPASVGSAPTSYSPAVSVSVSLWPRPIGLSCCSPTWFLPSLCAGGVMDDGRPPPGPVSPPSPQNTHTSLPPTHTQASPHPPPPTPPPSRRLPPPPTRLRPGPNPAHARTVCHQLGPGKTV